MYNSKRFNNMKTVSIENGTAIAFVTKSGTVMGEHCIRQIDDESGMKLAIAYNLTPAAARSLSSKTHSAKEDDRRAYYILDMGEFCPHIHRVDTCDAPCSYQENTEKKVLAFAGDADGVEVTASKDGRMNLKFTPKAAGEEANETAFAVILKRVVDPDDEEKVTTTHDVRKVQLVTLR